MGDVVGNHRILRRIGAGGMGAVYLAEHALLGRKAAIKVLLREKSNDPDLVARFFTEARAASAVKHPGIVEIYDFGYDPDGSAYIVMEYLEGESLGARLRRSGPLSAAQAAELVRQVAGALGAAHAKGIVHRDLKPDNIFIVPDPDTANGERTKILDFGIAKLGGDHPGLLKTRTGAVMGTPVYMSPEQSKGAGNVDARADLYALGCILFEMVCGRPPFVAEGGGEVMAQHIYAPVPAASSFAPVAPELEQLLTRALAKAPARRFQSTDELVAALQVAVPSARLSTASAAEAPDRRRAPTPIAPPHQTTLSAANTASSTYPTVRRRPWLAPAVAAAILGAAAMFALGRSREDPPHAARAPDSLVVAPPPPPLTTSTSPPPLTTSTPPPLLTTSAATTTSAAPPTTSDTAPSAAPPPTSDTAPSAAPPTRSAAPAPSPTQAGPAGTASREVITIHLTSAPPGADVYRLPQGLRLGITPLKRDIDAGQGDVVLVVRKRGYLDREIAIPADRDADRTVALSRVPETGTRPPAASGAGSGSALPPTQQQQPTPPIGRTLDPFDKLPPPQRRH